MDNTGVHTGQNTAQYIHNRSKNDITRSRGAGPVNIYSTVSGLVSFKGTVSRDVGQTETRAHRLSRNYALAKTPKFHRTPTSSPWFFKAPLKKQTEYFFI
jgi:hypothetical protein